MSIVSSAERRLAFWRKIQAPKPADSVMSENTLPA
jgi:hypothetical protein